MRFPFLFVSLCLLVQAPHAEPAGDPSTALSQASSLSLEGGAALVEGVSAGGRYVLVALEPLGEGVLAVFEAAGGSTRVSLELSGAAAAHAGQALGAVLEPFAAAGGYSLVLAGEVIAFVPDELARSLHHRQRLSP